jgi:transposase
MTPGGFLGTDWREWRRFRALRVKEQGWHQRDIAEALGVSENTISRWLARARAGGPESLLAHPAPGHPARLAPAQRRWIPEFLWHGPEAHGYRTEVWTRARVAKVIQEEFGVASPKRQVSRLVKELHGTPQVPIRRALQRDEGALEHWRSAVWPELRKQSRRERRVLVVVDEAGFYLLPGVVKTSAPEGRTPVLRAKLTRDHLSVMGGMTPLGKSVIHDRQSRFSPRSKKHRVAHLSRFQTSTPDDALLSVEDLAHWEAFQDGGDRTLQRIARIVLKNHAAAVAAGVRGEGQTPGTASAAGDLFGREPAADARESTASDTGKRSPKTAQASRSKKRTKHNPHYQTLGSADWILVLAGCDYSSEEAPRAPNQVLDKQGDTKSIDSVVRRPQSDLEQRRSLRSVRWVSVGVVAPNRLQRVGLGDVDRAEEETGVSGPG